MEGERAQSLHLKPTENGVSEHSRRSANYKPNIWEYDLLRSLGSNYDVGDNDYRKHVANLKEKLKAMFSEAVDDEVGVLELVEFLRKMGISNIFEEEIHMALQIVATSSTSKCNPNAQQDLYVVALRFRMLRLHGYDVSQDVFEDFLDEDREFPKGKCGHVKGLIALYEASYLATEGEHILDRAKAHTTKSLKSHLYSCGDDYARVITHILELSSHWRVSWFDVKWHINMYENREAVHVDFIRFAKLHFNVVQATLQNDICQLVMWWKDVNLIEHLGFARDRLVECFMCSVGLAFEPQFSFFRKCLTKVIIFILLIDDVYDVYGSLEELRHFTTAVKRWDLKEAQGLPEGMNKCLEVLFDVTHEMAYEIQKQMGWNPQVVHSLQKVWADFCEALFVEAKCFDEGQTPTLKEYLNNAWLSSSGSVICVHSFLCMMLDPQEKLNTLLPQNQHMVYNISIIIRLCNDLATSRAEIERGDAPSSILCYMREARVSEEEAADHIKGLVNRSWKNINEKCFKSHLPFHPTFVEVLVNIGRVAHNLYQYGDGFGVQDKEIRHQILSLLIQPYQL